MRAIDLRNLTWRKSGYSNSDGGECLEVAAGLPSLVPARAAILFAAPAWAAFADGVKRR
ncbi:DUF397 domain-containing protein [Streptomyces sp. NPDC005827]|uniref:DUF397 domain-containing protein n=1 Tax=Streptomyces sp. NPDC005827 TaxID=3157070 RepID=UPI00341125EF